MGRRIASQVHHQVSRLMRNNLVITREPKWYQPVLNFPPLPLPPKAPPQRTEYDTKMKPIESGPQQKLRRPKNRPLPIHYIEDDIRRRFYSDHPFEAFRPTTLVEKGDIQLHEVNGEGWTRLRQRGRNPTVEDAIQFTLNLHQEHKIPLSQAYAKAVAQFRSLRSERHIATTFAVMEAEHLGATFARGEIEHAFEKEKRALATWEKLTDMDEGSLVARKRWKMIADPHEGESNWSRGVEYVKLWQRGIRVNYSPALTKGVDEDLEEEPDRVDDPLHYDSQSSRDTSDILTTEEFDALVEEHILGPGVEDYEEEGEEEEGGEEGEEDGESKAVAVEDEGLFEEDYELPTAEDEGVAEEEGPLDGSDFVDFTKK
ncbi:mitochondrial ribosomal protein S25-domain-containing protein [Mycena maculata]|uniref:Small ribosomal subunit protein mS23 n=1 Tax=Mycena maculata TaxID=230809 RepID=A0AAD7IV91_9AGAR|nr:mitochondrial ribosomal protein S25-domain-containing protein [Mycena maculata]